MSICNFIYQLSITLCGTFVGFFLALYANSSIKKNEEEKLMRGRLSYLLNILDTLINYIPDQLNCYTRFSVEIENAPLELHRPEIFVTFDLLRMLKADNVDTQRSYFYFFRKDINKFKNYKTLFGQGDYLYRELELMESSIVRANFNKINDQNAIVEKFHEISLLLGKRSMYLIKTLGNNVLNNSEFVFIDKLAMVYGEIITEYIVFQKLKDKFITPLFPNILANIKDEDLANKIFDLTRIIDGKLKSIEMNELTFIAEINQFIDRVTNSLRVLESEAIKIKNLKFISKIKN